MARYFLDCKEITDHHPTGERQLYAWVANATVFSSGEMTIRYSWVAYSLVGWLRRSMRAVCSIIFLHYAIIIYNLSFCGMPVSPFARPNALAFLNRNELSGLGTVVQTAC